MVIHSPNQTAPQEQMKRTIKKTNHAHTHIGRTAKASFYWAREMVSSCIPWRTYRTRAGYVTGKTHERPASREGNIWLSSPSQCGSTTEIYKGEWPKWTLRYSLIEVKCTTNAYHNDVARPVLQGLGNDVATKQNKGPVI